MKGLVGKDLEFYCEMRNDWKVLNRGRIWHEFILKGCSGSCLVENRM